MIEPGDILTHFQRKSSRAIKRSFSYPNLHEDVEPGNKILIDDGKLEVVVTEITKEGDVKVKVTYGGTLFPKKSVNLLTPRYLCRH